MTSLFRILFLSLFLVLAGCGGDNDRFDAPEVTTPDDTSGGDGGDEGAGDGGDEGTGDEGTGDAGTGDEGTGDEGTTGETIEIIASLGLINGADVSVATPDGTAIAGATGTLDATGTVSVTHDGSYTGPIVVTVSGNDSATYFDESAGATLPMPASVSLRAFAPAPQSQLGVTILTELAAQVAAQLGSAITASDVEAINDSIRDTFAPDLSDILTPPTIVSEANFTDQSLTNDDAGIYALTLAGLATLAAGDTSPALSILEQLAADLADGDIDGTGIDGALTDLDYAAGDFANLLSAAIQTAASTLADTDLVTRANSFSFSIDANILEVIANAGVTLPDVLNDLISGGGSDGGTGGGTGGGVDISGLYDLTITGEVRVMGIGTAFDVTINDIVAPSPSDTAEVQQVIEETVAGLDNITSLTVTIITNTDAQVTFDVSFSAEQQGVSVDVSLRYDYVKGDGASSGDSGDSTGDAGDAGDGATGDDGSSSADDIAALGQVCFFGGGPSAATIPESLAGLWNVRYFESRPGAPYASNELVHFTVGTDGTLNINNQITLSTPVLCNGNEQEAYWKDSDNNLLYALSSLVSGFNEINVFSGTDGAFLGQFADPE